MTAAGWANLAAAGLIMFYLIYFGVEIALHTMAAQIGVDYADCWNTGTIATR